TIRAEFEQGETKQNQTRPWIGMDLDRYWRNFGRPTHTNFVNSTGAWVNPNSNPNNPLEALGATTGRPYAILNNAGHFMINTDTGQACNMRQMVRTTDVSGRSVLLPGQLPVPISAVQTSPHLG